MKTDKRTYRHLKNMEHICSFDRENAIAHVPLYYASPEEMLDIHVSRPDRPVVSDDTIDYIRDIISNIPDDFQVDISLVIDDYGPYDHQQLMDSLRATIENTYYYHDEKRRQSNVLAIFFLIIGFLVLCIDVIGCFAGWFGEDDSVGITIIDTVACIFAWIFLWEGSALLLLTYEEDSHIFSRQMQRFHKVDFSGPDGNPRSSMDQDQFYDGWVHLSFREVFSRSYILFSNAILAATMILEILRCCANLSTLSVPDMILYLFSWAVILLLVICNVSFYMNKGKWQDYALPVSVGVLICNLGYIGLFLTGITDSGEYFPFCCVFSAALIVNIICLKYMKKLSVEI